MVVNVEKERTTKQVLFLEIAKYCVPLAACHSAKLYPTLKTKRWNI